MGENKFDLKFTLNNVEIERTGIDTDLYLIDLIHEDRDINLTGTKHTCGEEACGTCTVAVRDNENKPFEKVLACKTLGREIKGKQVVTIEGIGDENNLHPLQKSFLDNYAFQCGFCTPGFLMSGFVLIEQLKLESVKKANLDEVILKGLRVNICRCAGYQRYFECIKNVILATPGLVE